MKKATAIINRINTDNISQPSIDGWDILSVFILLIIAVAFFIGDYARKKVCKINYYP